MLTKLFFDIRFVFVSFNKVEIEFDFLNLWLLFASTDTFYSAKKKDSQSNSSVCFINYGKDTIGEKYGYGGDKIAEEAQL